MAEKKEDITVVAAFSVTYPDNRTETVKGFDLAWRATRKGPHPCYGKFIGWKRLEKKRPA